jgi:hypothetical protein
MSNVSHHEFPATQVGDNPAMLNRLKKMLGIGGAVPGFTQVNEAVQNVSELIYKCVAVQIVRSGASPRQVEAMRTFILGYIAALAEHLAPSIEKTNPQAAAALISILAAAKLAGEGASHQEILQEFEELTALRDFGFGQGGAVALEDYEVLLNQEEPQGLKEYLTPA